MKVDDMVFGFNDVRFEDLVSQTANFARTV